MTPLLRPSRLAMAAPAVVLTAMLRGGPAAAPADPFLLVVLLWLGAVARNFPVRVPPRWKTDAAPAVSLAAVLLFPPVTAVALIGGSRLLGEGVLCFRRNPATGYHRRQPIDLVFNTSRFMTAGGLSALAYWAAGTSLAGALVATVVIYAVSTGLDVIAAGMHNQRNPLEIWAEIFSADSKPTAALYVARYLLALLSTGRPWLAVVMMVPIAAIQLALTRSMQLMEQTIAPVESMADVVHARDPYTFPPSPSVPPHSLPPPPHHHLPA